MILTPGPIAPLLPHDITRRCVKCQTLSVATVEYLAFRPLVIGAHVFTGTRYVGPSPALDECLLRTCRDCGWAWLEACADATHGDETP